MALFEEDYSGEKNCVFEHMLKTESVPVLKGLLQFEDLIVGGYTNHFPNKIMYKWEDVKKLENQ
jgi:hypothetical protein